MGWDHFLLLGDVGATPVYLVETLTKFGQATDSTHTLNVTYVDDAGQ